LPTSWLQALPVLYCHHAIAAGATATAQGIPAAAEAIQHSSPNHTEKFCFRFASPAPPSTLDGIKALIADTPAISSVWIADCLYLSAIQRLARQPPACVTFVPYFRRRSCRVSISVSDVRLSEANADADRRQKAGEGNRREEAGG
jgi:hypothetical protein